MTFRLAAAGAALLILGLSGAQAQAPAAGGPASAYAQSQDGAEEAKPARRSRKKRDGASKKEPTVGQMAARERQRKCSAEWKEAKAGGKAQGLTWPKFWSQCNARLKGKTA